MKKITLILILIVSGFSLVFGQSYNMGSIASPATTCSGTFYDSSPTGNYANFENYTATFCAPAGQYLSFNFSLFSLGFNDNLLVYNGPNTSSPLIGNYAGTTSPGIIGSTQGGCLTFVFTSDGVLRGPGWTAAISCSATPPATPGGTNCALASPFCTGTTYTFPNNTGVASLGGGGIYGCLGSTPNPVWYFMQVANSGNIDITIGQNNTGNTGIDVDFVLWGPFTTQSAGCGSLASTNIIDCSYSTAAVETANITNAVSGQFYILLLTNFANQSGNISFSQSGGTGSTNCNVLCNMTALSGVPSACDPATGTYSVSGNITFQYPPTSGTLTISSSCGTSINIPSPWTSPLAYTIPGLTANGASCNVTAAFSADATCTRTQAYTAPASCSNCTVTAGNTGPICTGATFGLTATAVTGGTYAWTGPNGYTSSAQNPTGLTAPGTAGTLTYSLSVTTASGTCNSTTTVTLNPTPQVSSGTSQTITCVQTNSLLDASSSTLGANLVWNGGSLTNAADPQFVTAADTYTVTASIGTCTSTSTIIVANNLTPPVPSFTTPDGTVLTCAVPSVTLNGNATPVGSTVAWTGTSGSIAGNPVTISAPGNYTLTATNPANGCTATATVGVTSNGATPNISVTTSPNTTVISCIDTLITITGASSTLDITEEWTGPGGPILANPIQVQQPGTYTYQVTDNVTGCQASSSVNITVDTLQPNIQISAPNPIITCLQPAVSLVGTSTTTNTTFTWSQNGTGIAGNPISVTNAGTYNLLVVNSGNGCSSTAFQVVTIDVVAPNAGITAPSANLTCLVTSVSLLGTSTTVGAQIAWNGPTGATITNPISTSTVGTYTLTVVNPTNGCSSTATQAVTENVEQPDINFTTPLGTILDCNTPTVTLDGTSTTPNTTFQWTGSAGPVVGNPATIGSPDTYTLTATDATNGCTTIITANITSTGATPNISYTQSNPQITCAINSIILNGASTNPNTTIAWASASGPLTGNPVTVNAAGSYTLTVTDIGTGCVSTNIVNVGNDITPPNASIFTTISTLTCASPTSNLNGISTLTGATFAWTAPSGAVPGNPINASTVGTYTLTVTNPANGCTTTQTTTLNSNLTAPTINITAPSTLITCSNPSLELTAAGNPTNVSYLWGGMATGSNPIVYATTPGNYSVLAVDPANGCSSTATLVITQDIIAPNATAGDDETVDCTGQPRTLTGGSTTNGVTYFWSGPGLFSASTQTTTSNVVGNYTLTVTNPANGCKSSDIMAITTNTLVPNVNAGLNQSIKCNKQTVALAGSSSTVSTPPVTYSWAGPSIAPPQTVTTAVCSTSVAGIYTLTVTNPATGCSASDQVVVTTSPNPNAAFTANPTSGTVPLAVSLTNASTASNAYAWSFGNGSSSTTVNPSTIYNEVGTYTVTLTSFFPNAAVNATTYPLCVSTATLTIEVKPVSQVIIPNIFSPNGDNINELFQATSTGLTELTIEVYDRWGLKKASFNGLTSFWNGADASDGTYFYIAKGMGIDAKAIDQAGFFMLVR